MTDGGFTRAEYVSVGVVHPGEYIFPAPYDYPKWTRWIWPRSLRSYLRRKFRTYNPDKDYFKKLTGVDWTEGTV